MCFNHICDYCEGWFGRSGGGGIFGLSNFFCHNHECLCNFFEDSSSFLSSQGCLVQRLQQSISNCLLKDKRSYFMICNLFEYSQTKKRLVLDTSCLYAAYMQYLLYICNIFYLCNILHSAFVQYFLTICNILDSVKFCLVLLKYENKCFWRYTISITKCSTSCTPCTKTISTPTKTTSTPNKTTSTPTKTEYM